MRKRCLLGILAFSSLAAGAQTLEGAKVTRLQGQVQVRESSVWRLLKEGEHLAESTLLKLAQGSHLSLRYRSDGHREEAEGPGEVVVGKGGLTGGGKLERFGFKNRQLQIPRSGGLDAVGGSVANATPRSIPPMPAPITAPVTQGSDPGPLAMRLRDDPEPPNPPAVELAYESTFPQLTGAVQQAVVFEGDVEVARVGSGPLDMANYASNSESLYRVELQEGSVTFRALEPEEVIELAELKATEVPFNQRLERMDRFSELGQYHLAAQEGGLWLRDRHSQADPEQRAAVLQLVYDLNRDILHDARQTAYWSDWATRKGVPLIP